MTKDEITRGLRICGKKMGCGHCPCKGLQNPPGEFLCAELLMLRAADLIEQQAARIAELEAIGLALKSRLDLLKEQLRYDEQNRDIAGLLVGAAEEKFYAGRCEATKEEIGWLERMVRDG